VRVLALDTSTPVGSVAVVVDDAVVCELTIRVRESHGETLLPWVARALEAAGLAAADLDLVAYSRGPGSFTGVRIGLSVAKGLALATSVPLLGVSSLRTLAHAAALSVDVVCPVIDARKHELYAAALSFTADGVPTEVVPEMVGAPAVVGQRLRAAAGGATILLVGEGVTAYADELLPALGAPTRLAPPTFGAPRGVLLARLATADFLAGAREDPALAAPVYLRPADAEYRPSGTSMRGRPRPPPL
jgi:tRNA threonylcarbamoyladenosine biosynthesis protein TsaB